MSCIFEPQAAMRAAGERLASRDGGVMTSSRPEDENLTCALLAWQELGHKNADSLYEFIQVNRNKSDRNLDCQSCGKDLQEVFMRSSSFKYNMDNKMDNMLEKRSTMGPVVKLPIDTKIVMRVDTIRCGNVRKPIKDPPKMQCCLKDEIDAACCTDTACSDKLAVVDLATKKLQSRIAQLAKREAERVKLLERADEAWKDLELGYQRRLRLADEKEGLIRKQVQKTLDLRNKNKATCLTLAKTLRELGQNAEQKRDKLVNLEKQVCAKACDRQRVSGESARGDGQVAEQHCRMTQMDRELQFKEEQARRKVSSLESEVESARGLTAEAERAMRGDLVTIKMQIQNISEELMKGEEKTDLLKSEVEQLNREKDALIEDLDSCKIMCDDKMKSKLDEMKAKKKELGDLKKKVIDCQCKLPQDASIEVKRTPSLAALCGCKPPDKLLKTCSCTSLGHKLMSNLLADLFGGLQSELGEHGSRMPCQLLKCLEDRHNWDRASVVKSNLSDYFSKLLIGELDIAIAVSLEKYHARWVGASCADAVKTLDRDSEKWQDSVIERKAQALANKLAEQLFKEKADELTKKAKKIMSSGPPPCQCTSKQQQATFPCTVKTTTVTGTRKGHDTAFMKRTLQDVTQLKEQIENLKKDSIKRGDLREMENKITKIVNRATKLEHLKSKNKYKCDQATSVDENVIKEKSGEFRTNNNVKTSTTNRIQFIKDNLKYIKNVYGKNKNGIDKHAADNIFFNKADQSYAVNMCLCGSQDVPNKVTNVLKLSQNVRNPCSDATAFKQSKPINILPKDISDVDNENMIPTMFPCPSECICFNKVPSNTSIKKLLETLINNNSCCTQDLNNSDVNLNNSSLEDNNLDLIQDQHFYQFDSTTNELNKNNNGYRKPIINGSQAKENYGKNYGHFDKINDLNLSKPIASEYMGAINLDKSNENFCKCVINKTTKINNSDDAQNAEKTLKEKYKSNLDTGTDKKLYYNETISTKSSQSNKNKTRAEGNSSVSEKSDLIAHNNDYCVKLLGVTLTQPVANNELSIVELSSPRSNKQNTCPFVKDIKCADGTIDNGKISEKCSKSCKYREALEDLYLKDTMKSKDVSSKNKVATSCVCCKSRESELDIEVNTFNLLEEHLKEKLKELKLSSDNFTISVEEEEKVFSTILDKVKQFISNSTCELSCKCLLENKEGSWCRAYGLLKEYLKMKIQKAQCSCSANNSSDKFLPSVLEKVCSLIENDFEKLKNKVQRGNINTDIKPTLINSDNQTSNNILNRNHNEVSIQSDINDQTAKGANMSAQVSFNFNSQNKSCDPLKISNIDTIEKKVSCKLGNNIYVTDCNCRPAFIESNVGKSHTKSIPVNKYFSDKSLVLKTEHLESNKITSGKYSDAKSKIPYIGYTLNCSCDRRLGQCFCSESVVNNNQIKLLWQSITSQYYPKNISYIMNGTPNNADIKQNLSIETASELSHDNKTPKSIFCNTDTGNREDITLKNTLIKENITYNDSETLANMSSDYIYEMPMKYKHKSKAMATNKKILFDSLNLPSENLDNGTEICDDDSAKEKINKSSHNTCDCDNVPLCHVKMLVDDIKTKLLYSECICDTLSADVCPLHSKIH